MDPFFVSDDVTLFEGQALDTLRELPSGSVNCVVTSPPYFWMRDYDEDGQIGLEATPQDYLDVLREVFAEIRRILTADGTLWLNLGDAYSQRKAVRRSSHQEGLHGARGARPSWRESRAAGRARMSAENLIGGRAVPEKSLMMLPDRLAMTMIDDGWLLRSKVVWAKTFASPDPAADRLASKWEPIYLFSKSHRYWFDRAALDGDDGDVWRLPASSGAGEHTASFPPALPDRCIRLGCPLGGVVLDPFCGSGTTGRVALSLGRRFVGIDLSARYLALAAMGLMVAAPRFESTSQAVA